MRKIQFPTTHFAWAGLPVFMAVLMGCGGDQKHANEPDPDPSEEVKEAGNAAATDVKESAKDVKEGAKDAAQESKEAVEGKDLDGDGDK